MTQGNVFVAVDLGAESGRIMAGTLLSGKIDLQEVCRFPNVPVRTPDGLHWDVLRLYAEILDGLRAATREYAGSISGLAIDSWAVDYGLLDERGRLLGMPYHYRDARTDGVRDQVAQVCSPVELYARTGIAQLPFNTLYQLVAQRNTVDGTLDLAHSLLMIPDLLNYWLTGRQATEYTVASTTGALGVDGCWVDDVLTRLDLPSHIFHPTRTPGCELGTLRDDVQRECGVAAIPVFLPASHDTASAVVAVPAMPAQPMEEYAYLSSGTWSLLGVEVDRPILSEEARLAGFTNEGGVGGRYRFLTNIMGLWILQECRRAWSRQGIVWEYQDLIAAAAESLSPEVIIDVADPEFLHPVDMTRAIAAQLQETNQRPVTHPAALTRCILEGLALAYREAVARVEHLTQTPVKTIHIVGGGVRNSLLCRLTADACERPVLAGPVEATAIGNVLVQALGSGLVRDLEAAREITRASTAIAGYEPSGGVDWSARSRRLHSLRNRQAADRTGQPVQ